MAVPQDRARRYACGAEEDSNAKKRNQLKTIYNVRWVVLNFLAAAGVRQYRFGIPLNFESDHGAVTIDSANNA